MGGDSASSDESNGLVIVKNEKVFYNGEFLIGYTTSFRMGQLLQYTFKPPKIKTGQDVMGYMSNNFATGVRKMFLSHAFGKEAGDDGQEGGKFIVGFRHRLFIFQNDFSVLEHDKDYAAAGCGEDMIYGSLFTTEKLCIPPAKRIELALQSAEQFSSGVRAPFYWKTLG